MFNKKEKVSLVSQLKEEVGIPSFSPIDRMGWFTPFFIDKEKDENRKMFADLLESYLEEYVAENYKECSDCGCLIVEDKAFYVLRNGEKIDYCKHCKPAYDEILTKYDEEKEERIDVGYIKNGVACDENGKI